MTPPNLVIAVNIIVYKIQASSTAEHVARKPNKRHLILHQLSLATIYDGHISLWL